MTPAMDAASPKSPKSAVPGADESWERLLGQAEAVGLGVLLVFALCTLLGVHRDSSGEASPADSPANLSNHGENAGSSSIFGMSTAWRFISIKNLPSTESSSPSPEEWLNAPASATFSDTGWLLMPGYAPLRIVKSASSFRPDGMLMPIVVRYEMVPKLRIPPPLSLNTFPPIAFVDSQLNLADALGELAQHGQSAADAWKEILMASISIPGKPSRAISNALEGLNNADGKCVFRSETNQ